MMKFEEFYPVETQAQGFGKTGMSVLGNLILTMKDGEVSARVELQIFEDNKQDVWMSLSGLQALADKGYLKNRPTIVLRDQAACFANNADICYVNFFTNLRCLP